MSENQPSSNSKLHLVTTDTNRFKASANVNPDAAPVVDPLQARHQTGRLKKVQENDSANAFNPTDGRSETVRLRVLKTPQNTAGPASESPIKIGNGPAARPLHATGSLKSATGSLKVPLRTGGMSAAPSQGRPLNATGSLKSATGSLKVPQRPATPTPAAPTPAAPQPTPPAGLDINKPGLTLKPTATAALKVQPPPNPRATVALKVQNQPATAPKITPAGAGTPANPNATVSLKIPAKPATPAASGFAPAQSAPASAANGFAPAGTATPAAPAAPATAQANPNATVSLKLPGKPAAGAPAAPAAQANPNATVSLKLPGKPAAGAPAAPAGAPAAPAAQANPNATVSLKLPGKPATAAPAAAPAAPAAQANPNATVSLKLPGAAPAAGAAPAESGTPRTLKLKPVTPSAATPATPAAPARPGMPTIDPATLQTQSIPLPGSAAADSKLKQTGARLSLKKEESPAPNPHEPVPPVPPVAPVAEQKAPGLAIKKDADKVTTADETANAPQAEAETEAKPAFKQTGDEEPQISTLQSVFAIVSFLALGAACYFIVMDFLKYIM